MQSQNLTPGESFSNISFIFNLSTNAFTYVDQTFCNLLEINADQIEPAVLLSYLQKPDIDHLKTLMADLLAGRFVNSSQFRLQFPSKEKWINLSPFLINSESGKLIAGIASEITAEIVNTYTLNKYANKKNSILTVLSHDLRGPLGVAKNLSSVLEEKTVEPTLVKLAESVSKILKQSIEMITDLTHREFIETVEVQLVKKNINIAQKLTEYMEECRLSEPATQRVFSFFASHSSIYMNLDEAKFMQIFNNLMTNSLKFTQDGGKISLRVEDTENEVIFIFADDGIGIPEKFHSQIFKKFTEAGRVGLHGEPTVGVGLFIVKTIIDWHLGTISFNSEENKGTTFRISIPRDN